MDIFQNNIKSKKRGDLVASILNRGNCNFCNKTTNIFCLVCRARYCSGDCSLLAEDHPCTEVPGLVDAIKDYFEECDDSKSSIPGSDEKPSYASNYNSNDTQHNGNNSDFASVMSKLKQAGFNDLDNSEHGSTVAKILNKVKEININEMEYTPVMIPPFKQIEIAQTDNPTQVYVLDIEHIKHGVIACAPSSAYNAINEIWSYMGKFDDSLPYTPVEDEFVFAKKESLWGRAKVLRIVKQSNKTLFRLFFIDIGCERDVDKSDIRRYPYDFHPDCYTTLCAVKALQGKLKHEELFPDHWQTKVLLRVNKITRINGVPCLHI